MLQDPVNYFQLQAQHGHVNHDWKTISIWTHAKVLIRPHFSSECKRRFAELIQPSRAERVQKAEDQTGLEVGQKATAREGMEDAKGALPRRISLGLKCEEKRGMVADRDK